MKGTINHYYCLFYLLFALCACVTAQSEGDANVNNAEKSITIEIEHAINNENKFTPRGKITAKSLKPDSKQTPLLTQHQLTNEELAQIKAGSQKNGLYKIRARINSGEWVMSSTQLITLTCSNFRDEIKFHISNNGDLIGLSFFTRSPDKTCLSTKQSNPSSPLVHTHASTFDTIFQITAGIEDPRPFLEPTQSSLNSQTPGSNIEQKPEEKSFWQKYWYLILPGALLMISNLLNAGGTEEGRQQQQQPQQQGGAAPRKR